MNSLEALYLGIAVSGLCLILVAKLAIWLCRREYERTNTSQKYTKTADKKKNHKLVV